MALIEYLGSLTATIVIELCVAMLFGYRTKAALTTVVFMNLMTHPALAYILWFNAYFRFADTAMLIAILEILIVFVEWRLLYFVFGEKPWRLLSFSFAANASSFGAGLILFWL